eukprot:TRINITY_DN23534_c0_g1_i1.p1 TRINITY_DN23534_c0_g1~~TRINITY_DN23534_c0_g1_i1.p1  ORF type:complete len:261 (-),score=25.85 TRINITY_DN23534_c0_g1_i1:152-934(-)
MVTFGSHLVVADNYRLDLVSLDCQVLASFPFSVTKSDAHCALLEHVATSSDRLGVLTCRHHWGRLAYVTPSEAPVELLLLDSQLNLVERVVVLTADDIGTGPYRDYVFVSADVVCIADQFLVVFTKADENEELRFFTVLSLSRGSSHTVLLGGASSKSDIKTACTQDRLLVCTIDLRAFCFASSGTLLWSLDIAGHLQQALPANAEMDLLRFDETAIFIRVPYFGYFRLTVDVCTLVLPPIHCVLLVAASFFQGAVSRLC